MGYTTDFYGEFRLDRPLTPEHKAYLEAFAGTRRMKRDAAKASLLPDPVREAAGLPIGEDGAYFVGSGGYRGQDRDDSIVDYNTPPLQPTYDKYRPDFQAYLAAEQQAIADGVCQPGLWCQWLPNEDGTAIKWDEGEKFYYYVEWLEYLIRHFLAPWGYTLNGEVSWQGEESEDRGVIYVKDNVVRDVQDEIVNRNPFEDEIVNRNPFEDEE